MTSSQGSCSFVFCRLSTITVDFVFFGSLVLCLFFMLATLFLIVMVIEPCASRSTNWLVLCKIRWQLFLCAVCLVITYLTLICLKGLTHCAFLHLCRSRHYIQIQKYSRVKKYMNVEGIEIEITVLNCILYPLFWSLRDFSVQNRWKTFSYAVELFILYLLRHLNNFLLTLKAHQCK